MENYYDLLGIKQNASIEEIKKAYKRMMMKYHPDRNKSKEAEKIAKAVNQAYHILGDPVRRQDYDFQLNFVTIPKQDYTKGYATPQEYWSDISETYKEAQRQQEELRKTKGRFTYQSKKQRKARKVRVQTSEGYYDIEFKT